jgi:hypothetical protein
MVARAGACSKDRAAARYLAQLSFFLVRAGCALRVASGARCAAVAWGGADAVGSCFSHQWATLVLPSAVATATTRFVAERVRLLLCVRQGCSNLHIYLCCRGVRPSGGRCRRSATLMPAVYRRKDSCCVGCGGVHDGRQTLAIHPYDDTPLVRVHGQGLEVFFETGARDAQTLVEPTETGSSRTFSCF